MIIDKIKLAAKHLKSEPDFSKSGDDENLIGVIDCGKIMAFPVAQSLMAPIGPCHLLITPYPLFAAVLSKQNKAPVWLYDRISDIKHMSLPSVGGPPWVILTCRKDDFVCANALADRWTYGPYEVTVMMGKERQLLDKFAVGYSFAA